MSTYSNVHSEQNFTDSSLTIDPNTPRRHSMDEPALSSNNTFVKSQSTIMPSPMISSVSVTESSLSPNVERRKSVSSKERLFSVESLNRRSSIKSAEHLMKVATHSDEALKPTATTTLSITTPENVRRSNNHFP